jgi:acyl-CoA thioesterase-1
VDVTRDNLEQIVTALQGAGARVILAGMTLPPNYGPSYITRFQAVFSGVAARHKLTLIPFLLQGVGGNGGLMQRDGLHPNAEGTRIVAATVLKTLVPFLQR